MDFTTFALEFMTLHSRHKNKASHSSGNQDLLDAYLLPTFGHLQLQEITVPHILAFEIALGATGISPSTTRNRMVLLRTMLNRAVKWNHLAEAPKFDIPRAAQTKPKAWKREEIVLLASWPKMPWSPMFRIAAFTGLRLGELLALRWEDVYLSERKVVVARAIWKGIEGTPKSGKGRSVPLSPLAIEAFRELPRVGKHVLAKVPNGGTYTGDGCRMALERARKKFGLKRRGWHGFRHFYGSHLSQHGAPLATIQDYMGHASITTTQKYLHRNPDADEEVMDTFDKFYIG